MIERIDFSWDGPRLAESLHWRPDGSVEATTWDYRPGGFTPITQTNRSWLATAPQTEIDRRFHTIVCDLVGTPTHLIDPDGGIAWHTQTTIWGTTIRHQHTGRVDCPLRFPGQYHDPETGHHYNNQRHYDPETGRYLTKDPLGLAPSPNPAAYVNNPIAWVDPLGLTADLSCSSSRFSPGNEPRRISPGGRPDGQIVFAGHGRHDLSDGNFRVPEGTEVRVYVRYGSVLDDMDGYYIESGRDYPPAVRTYTAGEYMPNFTLFPPRGLWIREGSTTVDGPTLLSNLVTANSGTVHWAGCSSIR